VLAPSLNQEKLNHLNITSDQSYGMYKCWVLFASIHATSALNHTQSCPLEGTPKTKKDKKRSLLLGMYNRWMEIYICSVWMDGLDG